MHCNDIPVYWHCPRIMRSRVYLTVGCPSVCLSVCLSRHSTAAATCGRFAAERRAGRRYRPTAAVAQQQRRRSTALSSKRRQCYVDSRVDEAQHTGLVDLVNL